MSASQPFSSWVAAAPVQTDALPPPLPRWAVYVLLAPIAAGYYLGMDADSISGLVHRIWLPLDNGAEHPVVTLAVVKDHAVGHLGEILGDLRGEIGRIHDG